MNDEFMAVKRGRLGQIQRQLARILLKNVKYTNMIDS